jgi:hypothetical protein
VRVRTLQLRLLAAALAVLWGVSAAIVLVGYRPGGPLDIAVGLASIAPLLVAIAAVAWPPVVRGSGAYAGVVWLGLAAALLIVPSLAEIAGRIGSGGPQTLLPSLEAIYPWLLALAATATLAGIGIARHALGADVARRRRLVAATGVAIVLLAVSGAAFAVAAVANELALRDRPVGSSPYGPAGVGDPVACDAPIAAGAVAQLAERITADVDGRSLGSLDLAGERSGADFRWSARVAGERGLGTHGAARIMPDAWTRAPGSGWVGVDAASLEEATVDLRAIEVALLADVRTTAEDRGLEFVEGAAARHCRVAIDGDTFVAAFPQAAWLVGDLPPLSRWRGDVDYWIFLDDEVGLIEGTVSGSAGDLRPGALQAALHVRLTATRRDEPVTLMPPG